MREGWEYKKFGEVAAFYRGLTYTGKDEVDFSNNVVLRSNNVDLVRNTLNLNELKYISDEITIPKDKMVKKDSILMCMSNGSKQHIGKVAYINKDYNCAFGGFMGLIIPNENYIIPKLLYYYCCSCTFKQFVLSIVNGANINNLRFSDLSNKTVPIPFFSIQSVILSELDMITEMISKYDEQLNELDKLSQSIFYEMFGDPVENEKGWEVKTLKNISEKITSGNNAKLATGTYKSEGIPYFRCQNVWKNRIDFKDMVYIDEETNQKLKSSVLKHNDLLITKIGRINTENSSLGRVSIYVGEDFKANLSGNLCFIRLLDTVNPIFVLNIMISNYFRDYIRRTTVGGTDKRALKSPQIGRFPIILPPLPLQQSFARKIEAIEAMKSKVREAKKEAETLLAARMQYWFE